MILDQASMRPRPMPRKTAPLGHAGLGRHAGFNEAAAHAAENQDHHRRVDAGD